MRQKSKIDEEYALRIKKKKKLQAEDKNDKSKANRNDKKRLYRMNGRI